MRLAASSRLSPSSTTSASSSEPSLTRTARSAVATLWQHSYRPMRPMRPKSGSIGRSGRRRTHLLDLCPVQVRVRETGWRFESSHPHPHREDSPQRGAELATGAAGRARLLAGGLGLRRYPTRCQRACYEGHRWCVVQDPDPSNEKRRRDDPCRAGQGELKPGGENPGTSAGMRPRQRCRSSDQVRREHQARPWAARGHHPTPRATTTEPMLSALSMTPVIGRLSPPCTDPRAPLGPTPLTVSATPFCLGNDSLEYVSPSSR
jgi:hypothetical protein